MKSRKMRREGRVLCVWEKGNAWGILMGRPEEKKPLEPPGFRWGGGNNITTNLKGTGWNGLG